MDIVGSIFNLLISSIFSINTYIGIVLGALFTPLWIAAWRYAKLKVISKWPAAAIFVRQLEIAVTIVDKQLDPFVDSATKSLDDKSNSLDKK